MLPKEFVSALTTFSFSLFWNLYFKIWLYNNQPCRKKLGYLILRWTLVFKPLSTIHVWAVKLSDKPDKFSSRTVSTSEHYLRTLKFFRVFIQFESKVTEHLQKRQKLNWNYSEYFNFFSDNIIKNFIGYVINFPGITSASCHQYFCLVSSRSRSLFGGYLS